jgi:hypothetical protein
LCAELVEQLQRAINDYGFSLEGESALMFRARKELAQPEREGATDEELNQLAIDTRLYRFQATAGDPVQYEMTEQQVHAFARAALARWGTPANTINQEDYDGG